MKIKRSLRDDLSEESNSAVDRKLRRQLLKCSICPPNKKENAKRKPKHGIKKPKRGRR